MTSDAGQCALGAGAARREWSESPPASPTPPTQQGLLPDDPLLVRRLPVGDHGAPTVAGAAGGRHTLAHIIQEGAVRAGAAVHRNEADAAGDVRVTPGPAGGLTGADVVEVGQRLGAGGHGLCCRMPGGGNTQDRAGPPGFPVPARPFVLDGVPGYWPGRSLASEPGWGTGAMGHPPWDTHCTRRPASRRAARPGRRRPARRRTGPRTCSPHSSRSCTCRTCSSGGGIGTSGTPGHTR